MAKTNYNLDGLAQLRLELKTSYLQSPLTAIAEYFLRLIDELEEVDRVGRNEVVGLDGIADAIRASLSRLPMPNTLGQRSLFDVAMIQSIVAEWESHGARLSGIILPVYRESWGHYSVPFPALSAPNDIRIPQVDVVSLPGHDALDSIALTDYAWLCHELAHNLFLRHGAAFATAFSAELCRVTKQMRLRSFADSDVMKERSANIVAHLERMWTPTSDQQNWAFEVAADLVALWTCGPAFLAAFSDRLIGRDPYHATETHPPSDLRATVLLKAGKILGWDVHLPLLADQLKKWRDSSWNKDNINVYATLCKAEVIDAVTRCGLAACKSVGLPLCTESRIQCAHSAVIDNRQPEVGIDLLLCAWAYHQHLSRSDEYVAMERQVVTTAISGLTW